MPPKTIEGLKDAHRDAKRRLIADTARDLFARKDFRDVTVREIAKAAGVSVGTIYNHYPTLDELFLNVFLKSAEDITRMIDRALEKNASDALKTLCTVYVTYLNENMTFFQMMSHFILGSDLSPDATQKLNEIMRSLINRLEQAVRIAGIQTETRNKAHALFAALNGIMISYARYPGRTPDEIRRHTLKLTEVVAETFAGDGRGADPPPAN